MNTLKVFLFAGEISGDMHAARLLTELKERLPGMTLDGVAGPELRSHGIQGIFQMEDFSVMGFSDVLRSLPKLWRQFNHIRDHILKEAHDLVIFVDSPSFSLRMASHLRKRGFKGKLIQYISPTVWAWGKHRIQQMAATFDLLLTIYPFETPYFSQTSLRVEYVGNPIKEAIRYHQYDSAWQRHFGIEHCEHLIGLFPGSRKGEILRNLPSILEAAQMIKNDYPETVFAISCAHEDMRKWVQTLCKSSPLKFNKDLFLISKAYSYDLMRSCRSAIAKSGTVTLELALHQCPTVVVYQLTWLNRLIAKYALRIRMPHYCIVNILSNQRVFPELIEQQFSSETLYGHLCALHTDSEARKRCLADCLRVGSLLSEHHASVKAAHAIVDLLQSN